MSVCRVSKITCLFWGRRGLGLCCRRSWGGQPVLQGTGSLPEPREAARGWCSQRALQGYPHAGPAPGHTSTMGAESGFSGRSTALPGGWSLSALSQLVSSLPISVSSCYPQQAALRPEGRTRTQTDLPVLQPVPGLVFSLGGPSWPPESPGAGSEALTALAPQGAGGLPGTVSDSRQASAAAAAALAQGAAL